MSRFEHIRSARSESEPEVDVASSPSLAQFLSDERKSALLGDLIAGSGNPDDVSLGNRLYEKKIVATDLPRLATHYEDFAKIVEQSEEMSTYITPKLVERFAKNHEGFRQTLTNLGGVDSTAQLLASQTLPLGVRHPAQFQNIYASLQIHKSHIENEEKRMKAVVEKYGLKDSEYDEITAIADDKERKTKLRTAVTSKFMGFRKVLNKATFGVYGRLLTNWLESKEKQAVQTAITEESKFLEDFANVIASSVSANDDLRTALADVVQGVVPPITRRLFPFTEISTMRAQLSLDRVKEEWMKSDLSEKFHLPAGAGGALSDADKDAKRQQFLTAWKQKKLSAIRSKGTGEWAVTAENDVNDFVASIPLAALGARPRPEKKDQRQQQGGQKPKQRRP